MDSEEINKRIDKADDAGEKVLPYMGWYWRDVDFDNGPITLGLSYGDIQVGFMENNKWGYEELIIEKTHPLFNEIKELIIKCLRDYENTGDVASFEPVWDRLGRLACMFQPTILK